MGKNLILTQYLRNYLIRDQIQNSATGKKKDYNDKILLVTKDETGKKTMNFIEKPERHVYVLKKEYQTAEYGLKPAVDRDKVNEYIVDENKKFEQMRDILVENGDGSAAVKYEAIRNNSGMPYFEQQRALEQTVIKHPFVYNSDGDLTDQYIARFNEYYNAEENDDRVELTKGFFDIEVDGSDISGFPNEEEAPAEVNIITYFDNASNTCFTYCLKYDTDTYRESSEDGSFKDIIKTLEARYDGRDIKFVIKEFDREIDLIKAFFHQAVEVSRNDFMSGWNSIFDMLTLYNRLSIHLGQNPADYFCPSDAKYKYVNIKKDHLAADPADTSHTFDITGYTNWIDEETLYANITKPSGKRESYSLDYIGEYELNEHKDHFDGDIKTLHLNDYRTFMLYNIQDVILLSDIEHKTQHINLLYKISEVTNTRISKALKKTVSIRNFGEKHYALSGKVMSNNLSHLYPKNGKIPGAFVADPNYMDHVGIVGPDGKKSDRLFRFAADMDANSMYPSNIRAYNITPEAEKFTIIYKDIDPTTKELLNETPTFVDDLLSNDGFSFSQKYYKYPTVREMKAFIDSQLQEEEK